MSHLLINTTIHCYCRCPAVTTSSCCSTSTTTKLSHLHYITTCSRYITRSPPIISQNSPLLLQLSSHRPLQSSVKTPQCCFNCPVTVPSNHQSKLPNVASTVQSPSPPIISQNSPMLLQLSSHRPLQSSVKTRNLPNVASTVQSRPLQSSVKTRNLPIIASTVQSHPSIFGRVQSVSHHPTMHKQIIYSDSKEN